MSFFWKLVNETQISAPPEATRHHKSKTILVLLSLRANLKSQFPNETPCSSSHSIMLCLKNVVFASLAKSEIVAMIWSKNNVFWHNYFMVTLHINWQIDLAKMWLNFFSSYLQGLIFRRLFFFQNTQIKYLLKGHPR